MGIVVAVVAIITVGVLFVLKSELNGLLWGRRRTYVDPDLFAEPQCEACKSTDLVDSGRDPNDPTAGYRYRCKSCGQWSNGGAR
jgi:hypothetical protein